MFVDWLVLFWMFVFFLLFCFFICLVIYSCCLCSLVHEYYDIFVDLSLRLHITCSFIDLVIYFCVHSFIFSFLFPLFVYFLFVSVGFVWFF